MDETSSQKRNIFMACLLAGALALSGCATQQGLVSGRLEGSRPNVDLYSNFALQGIGQTDQHDVIRICGSANKVKGVEVYQSFGNILISGLTWGIYTPRTVRVYCK